MNQIKTLIISLFICCFFIPQSASSEARDASLALDGLSAVKVYYDIKADSAAKLEKRLVWINDTLQDMSSKGIKATVVIGFRSQASFFLTRDDEDLEDEDIPAKRKIKKWLKRFTEAGIRLEQCGLSADLFDIETQDFLAEITVIKNSYISMIGYQNKGYAYVPM